ncbi:MAG: hypothetical protein ACLRL4_10865 [Bifidobacterium bifidum]
MGSPVWFVRHLVSRGMLPAPKDGVFDVALVRASVAYQVGGLSTPLSGVSCSRWMRGCGCLTVG